jgi:hypothetical protein
MSIEEITGHLRAVKGRGEDEDEAHPTEAGGKLLLTEEQWQVRMKGPFGRASLEVIPFGRVFKIRRSYFFQLPAP